MKTAFNIIKGLFRFIIGFILTYIVLAVLMMIGLLIISILVGVYNFYSIDATIEFFNAVKSKGDFKLTNLVFCIHSFLIGLLLVKKGGGK